MTLQKNIYNFDRKKFMIGGNILVVWVKIYKKLKNREIIGSSYDGSQELVLIITAICVVAATILSTLIY